MSIHLEDSSTYQAIHKRGEEKGRQRGLIDGIREGAILTLQKTLLRQGKVKFGPVAPLQEASIRAITDLERLERMTEQLLIGASWEDVFDTL